jgi:hypothetical protein
MTKSERVIARVITMHDRGLLCPAEMWNLISDSLEGEDVDSQINGFSESTRRLLASRCLDLRYMNHEPFETRKAIFAWCQRNRVVS